MSNLFGGRGRRDKGADGPDKHGKKQGGAEMAESDKGAKADGTQSTEQQQAPSPGGRTAPSAGAGQRGQPRLWQELGVSGAEAGGEGAQRQLVIGNGVEVRGTISNCDEVIVEGSAQVEIAATRLSIRAGGQVSGSAHVAEAVVDGAFDGELSVDGLLAVTEAGCVTGTICYGSLEIGLGGRIIGDIQHGPRQTAAAPAEPAQSEEPTEAAAASA